MKTNNNSRFLFLDYIAFAIIAIAFFVISYCGFFTWDDIYMNYGVSTLSDVLEHTKMFYFTYGGRLFSVASQYLFSGVLGNNRIWYAIANTLFFTSLMMVCGGLINDNKEGFIFRVLLFALLFWFLCPVPSETLFLTAASTTYLWANTLSFVFLWFYLKYKDDNFGVVGKMGLFFMSVLAATEFITCASICGAFVVYYAFHIKKFKGNAVPFVAGFAIGSIILLFAPGGFERASRFNYSILDNIQDLAHFSVKEIVIYKILWMLLIVLVCVGIKNKEAVKLWMKNNTILLLSLGWSVISFSIVFRPEKRALFFPEILSLVLLLRFLFDNHVLLGMRFFDKVISNNRFIIRIVIISLLFVSFVVDSAFAIVETKKQSYTNVELMNELVDSGGIVAWDRIISSHRMAYITRVAPWSEEPLAEKYGLDSVRVYPYYCLDKYYKQGWPSVNIFIDEVRMKDADLGFDDGLFRKYIRLIVRIKTEELQESNNHVIFVIDYTRPRKWYKSWLDDLRNYQYERTAVVEIDEPEVCFDGYCYYIIWFGRENVKGLKSIKYEIE